MCIRDRFGGPPVGSAVGNRRVDQIKGRLSADRVRRLEALPGWSWDMLADQWEEGFDHLRGFAEREGHARVPQGLVEDGFQLGTWVANRR